MSGADESLIVLNTADCRIEGMKQYIDESDVLKAY